MVFIWKKSQIILCCQHVTCKRNKKIFQAYVFSECNLLIGMISLYDYYYCAHKERSVHWSFFVWYVTIAVHGVVQIPIANHDAMFLFLRNTKIITLLNKLFFFVRMSVLCIYYMVIIYMRIQVSFLSIYIEECFLRWT